MSLPVMVWVLRNSEERLGRRLVLLALAEFAHDDGTKAFPALATIAARARLSESQTRSCLRELEEAGSIEHTGDTSKGVRIYSVLMTPSEGGPESGGGRNTAVGGPDLGPDPGKDPVKESPTDDAQSIVAHFVDAQRAIGVEPPKRLVGHLAREVGVLLGEGQPGDVVRRAVGLLVDRRMNPAALPSLIPEASAGPARRQRIGEERPGSNLGGSVDADGESALPAPLPPPPTEEERAAAAERLREMSAGIGRAVDDV